VNLEAGVGVSTAATDPQLWPWNVPAAAAGLRLWFARQWSLAARNVHGC
jgi:hypothetical protein